MTKPHVPCTVFAVVILLAGLGTSSALAQATSTNRITVNVTDLKSRSIADGDTADGLTSSILITVTNADPNAISPIVPGLENPIPVPDRISATLPPAPSDVTALKLEVSDSAGVRITANLDAVLNTTQTITVVMPKRKPANQVVCYPAYCPPTYVQCSAFRCGRRRLVFWCR